MASKSKVHECNRQTTDRLRYE